VVTRMIDTMEEVQAREAGRDVGAKGMAMKRA